MGDLWVREVKKPCFPTLQGDVKTDVLIVGGGIAGILCAYMLKRRGVSCLIAEASEICGGVTQNTTAKITAQHGLIYDRLIRTFGTEKAAMYLAANQRALKEYRELGKTVNCHFEEKDLFVYSMKSRRKIERELTALSHLGMSADLVLETELPFAVEAALWTEHQAQFHPLELLYDMAKELNIFEHTKILELISGGARTTGGVIHAEKTIVATHFPFLNRHGSYFLKLYQHRSYVLALKNANAPKEMYVDEDRQGQAFRRFDDLLLLGGGGHRTGKRGGNYEELTRFAERYYPESREVLRFATQDCISLDGVPYIGQYSARTPSLYVATGFNQWGMTSAMAAAMILADQITDRENPYAAVFSPSRTILRPQLVSQLAHSAVSLLTPTAPRCPHMGCALKYNKAEHSWDCPCHGSRFENDGEVLEGPAQKKCRGLDR